jgi:hypothetical protein
MSHDTITIYMLIICISLIIGQYAYEYIYSDEIYLYKIDPELDVTRSEAGNPISEIIVNY